MVTTEIEHIENVNALPCGGMEFLTGMKNEKVCLMIIVGLAVAWLTSQFIVQCGKILQFSRSQACKKYKLEIECFGFLSSSLIVICCCM